MSVEIRIQLQKAKRAVEGIRILLYTLLSRLAALILPFLQRLPDQLPYSWLYGSFLVAFISLVVFDRRFSEVTFPPALRTEGLNTLTYYLDPLLLHLLGLFLCGYLTWRYLTIVYPKDRPFLRLVLSFGPPILLLTGSYWLEQQVLKPTFHYPRPGVEAQPLGDAWLTDEALRVGEQILKLMGKGDSSDPSDTQNDFQDVPSGFALRQLILFYLTVWVAEQQPSNAARLSSKPRVFVHMLNFFLLLLVIFSRVYRANHTFFAMTVAVGIGTLLFWAFLTFIYIISPKRDEATPSILAQTFGVYLALLLPLFAYANDAGRLLQFSVIFLFLLAVGYAMTKSEGLQ